MCTVSWSVVRGKGYELFFSRDESRSRIAALEPTLHRTKDDTTYLSPVDPKGGGSWIFVNEHGLTACVLNHYTAGTPQFSVETSRGQLLLSLADSRTHSDVECVLRNGTAARRYRPCFVLCLTASGSAMLWRWDGNLLASNVPLERPMLTTSSFETDAVLACRAQAFDALPDHAPSTLRAFHLTRGIEPSARTVRMSRPDARTVSFTRIAIDDGTASMEYSPRQGDGQFESAPSILTLPLFSSASE